MLKWSWRRRSVLWTRVASAASYRSGAAVPLCMSLCPSFTWRCLACWLLLLFHTDPYRIGETAQIVRRSSKIGTLLARKSSSSSLNWWLHSLVSLSLSGSYQCAVRSPEMPDLDVACLEIRDFLGFPELLGWSWCCIPTTWWAWVAYCSREVQDWLGKHLNRSRFCKSCFTTSAALFSDT